MATDESLFASFTGWVSLLAGILILVFWCRKRDPLLEAIPTVGFSDPILSYLSALRFFFDAGRMLKGPGGYKSAGPGLFKIATFSSWMVLLSNSELVEDIRKAPENVMSHREPRDELLQTAYTMEFLGDKHYHADVIRSKLMRVTPKVIQDIHDELVLTLNNLIPTVDEEWVKVPIIRTIQHMICRTSNRVFVGPILCRNRSYQDLNLNYATNVMKIATILRLFPKYLKPTVMRHLSNLASQVQQEIEFLRPLFEERSAKMGDLSEGDWADRPDDMLMWLMNEATGMERSLDGLARRMLAVNFASIHTTSITFTQVLYRLLANPDYIEPLRQEVEAAVVEEGWTKAGVDKMFKIDSFIRETQRLDAMGILALVRLALRPFTFSNGITIPAGVIVAAPLTAIHTDGDIYPSPSEFDGFRFAMLGEQSGDAMGSRHETGTTSTTHVTFGHGRRACPGRFFAAVEMKSLLAHILVTYDFKLEEDEQVPRDIQFGTARIPRNVDVLFRKRQK